MSSDLSAAQSWFIFCSSPSWLRCCWSLTPAGGLRSRMGVSPRAEARALIERRQESGIPVGAAAQRIAAVREHHEGGQVLVGGAQSISDPGAHRRPSGQNRSGIHLADRSHVVQPVRPAGTDDRHVIHVLGDVRVPVGHPHTALPVLFPLAAGRHQRVVRRCRGRSARACRSNRARACRRAW